MMGAKKWSFKVRSNTPYQQEADFKALKNETLKKAFYNFSPFRRSSIKVYEETSEACIGL